MLKIQCGKLMVLWLGVWVVTSGVWPLPSVASTVELPVENTSVIDFPGALWRDVEALPTTENLWWLLSGAALTVTVRQFEDPEGVAKVLNQGIIDPLVDAGNTWGDMKVQAPLALGVWALGSVADNREAASLGFDMSRSLLLTYGTVSVLKKSIQRTRPNGDKYSFPSGHTAAAFSTAGVVSRRYGGWAGGAAISLGVLTALGRMEDFKHYASDVAAGATIGWIIGRNAGRDKSTAGVSWRFVPLGQGVAVAGRF